MELISHFNSRRTLADFQKIQKKVLELGVNDGRVNEQQPGGNLRGEGLARADETVAIR